VMVVAVFFGIVNAFDIPGRQAFIAELVGKDDLMNAIALNSSMFNAARIVGPAVAGVVIGAAGVGMCFLLNGVSYIAVIAGLLAMRLPPFVSDGAATTAGEGVRQAIAFIRSDARVSALVVLVAVFSVLGFPFIVLMPVVARDVLHTDARGYGVLMAAVGVGAMLGALGLALRGRRVRKGAALLDGGATFGALLMLFAAVRSVGVALVLLALAGCAMIVTTALANPRSQRAAGPGDGVLRLRVRGNGAARCVPGRPRRRAYRRTLRDRPGRNRLSHRRGAGRLAGAGATADGIAEVREVGGGWRRLIAYGTTSSNLPNLL